MVFKCFFFSTHLANFLYIEIKRYEIHTRITYFRSFRNFQRIQIQHVKLFVFSMYAKFAIEMIDVVNIYLIKRSWVSQNFGTLEEELEMMRIAFGFKMPFFDKHLLAPKIGIIGRDFFGDKICQQKLGKCCKSVFF